MGKNRKQRDLLILLTASAILWMSPCVGQVLKGSISGTVVDPHGAVVANAQVKATHTSTGAVLTTKSDRAGLFRFNLIPAGTYKVEISAQGFKAAAQNDVFVTAGADRGLGDIRLAVGAVETTLEVTASARLIESTESQITNTFAGTTLQTFAGIQENQGLDNLALFAPGIASARDNNFSNTNGGFGFSANGLRSGNNDQEIDGQNNNLNGLGGPMLFVSDTEFVQQYVLITSQLGPEYGRSSGSVVNIITKSGTNAWHGSVYGNENNSIFNGMTSFQKNFATDAAGNLLRHPPRMNDEFAGFTIGGPLITNKLFFFGGFDQEVISENTIFHSDLSTPTPAGLAALAGCFPTGNSAAAVSAVSKFGPFGISGGNPFPTVNSGTGTFLNLVAACPTATFGGVTRVLPTPLHAFNFPLRFDWQTANNSVTGRYLYNRSTFFNINDNGAAGYVFNQPTLSQAVLASWTHNFASPMVNEARISFGRFNSQLGGNTIGNTEPIANQLDQGLANISFNGSALSLGFGPAPNMPQLRLVNTWQAQDNWNYVSGKHQLKAGFNWTYQRSPTIFLANINGAYRFSNWGRYFANAPNRIRVAVGDPLLDFREYDTFVYGGDDWKVTKHLTLNIGLTWTYNGQPANLLHQITVRRESDPSTAFWASTEPVGTNTLGDTFSNPAAAIPLSARTAPSIPAHKAGFGPGLGFTYSPQWGGVLTGRGKTVIRGGYRYLYDPPFYIIYLNNSVAAPTSLLQSISSPGTHPLPAVPTGPNVRASLASSIQFGTFDAREFAQTQITPNFGPDKVHSWNFGFEREITRNSAFSARYVGNAARGLFQTLNGNPYIARLKADFPNLVPEGLEPCPASKALYVNDNAHQGNFTGSDPIGRLDCSQGVVRLRANSGFSNYQGAQLEFRANNLFNQLTIRTGYTYSKNLDNVSEIFSTLSAGNTAFFAQNPADQIKGAGEYSFSGLDYPHTWTILFTEQLPFFQHQHGVVGHLLGGWAFSGNYILESGQHYTPVQAIAGTIFAQLGKAPDYYDTGFIASFPGIDTVRPFLGNLSAPETAIGAFAGDVCKLFDNGTGAACAMAPTTLISLNADAGCIAAGGPCPAVTTTKNRVRFIMNSLVAQSVFGTPFGDTPRNPVQDAITNVANFSVLKGFKLTERASIQFRATFLNVFNHANFSTIDPFIEDAGASGFLTGFGNPKLTDDVPGVVNFPVEASRRIIFGGKISF